MRERLRLRTIGLQYVAVVMAVFGGLALLLAIVGVYSLMAFVVAQRTHEIGVRIALGATRGDVLRLAVGQTARLTAAGALLGLVLATALGRLMEAGLLGVVSSDARLSIGFAAVLVLAALAAGYIPARRATAIDPIVALRAESKARVFRLRSRRLGSSGLGPRIRSLRAVAIRQTQRPGDRRRPRPAIDH